MAVKGDRSSKSRASKVGSIGSQTTTNPTTPPKIDPVDPDYAKMPANVLIKSILDINKDPAVEQLLLLLSVKVTHGNVSECLEAEIRSRSIVISGVEEAPEDFLPSQRQADVEQKVSSLLDVLKVECRPEKVLRMGNPAPSRPRLIKVVLPSKRCWQTALANSRLLRSAGYPNVFVRRSMTTEERKRDFELRQEARERNKGCSCQQGPPGAPGSRGLDGRSGKDGYPGINGRNGHDGRYVKAEASAEPPCQKCPSAPPGPPGHPGHKGPRGRAGTPGKNGTPGTPGRAGPPGPSGVRGPPGERGTQGPPGDSGGVLNGAPPGPPGRAGPAGPRGKPGTPGVDGRPGVTGPRGIRGLQGERGGKGALGPPGPAGAPGLVGNPGTCNHCPTHATHKPSSPPHSPAHIPPPSAVQRETDTISPSIYGEEPSPPSPAPRIRAPQPPAPTTTPSTTTTTTTRRTTTTTRRTTTSTTTTPRTTTTARTTTRTTPITTTSTAAPTTTQRAAPQTYAIDLPQQVRVQPAALPYHPHVVSIYDDEPAEPFTPEPNLPRRPVGYTRDQFGALPSVAVQESIAMFEPKTIRTKQGYNVQIVGSSYGANPVGRTWDAATPKHYNPAHYAQLAPPAPRYSRK